jgi:hypothetical protein
MTAAGRAHICTERERERERESKRKTRPNQQTHLTSHADWFMHVTHTHTITHTTQTHTQHTKVNGIEADDNQKGMRRSAGIAGFWGTRRKVHASSSKVFF